MTWSKQLDETCEYWRKKLNIKIPKKRKKKMRWINVDDDLPPNDVQCLVYARFKSRAESLSDVEYDKYIMIEATFNNKTGWQTPELLLKDSIYSKAPKLEILLWCGDARLPSGVASQAASSRQADDL